MNDEKAHELWRWLKANVDRWDQRLWTSIPVQYYHRWTETPSLNPIQKKGEGHTINCGTTACVAGHAAFMWAPEGTKFFREHLALPQGMSLEDRTLFRYSEYARRVLGLTIAEGDYLFDECRTIEEVHAFLTGDEIQREDILDLYYDEE